MKRAWLVVMILFGACHVKAYAYLEASQNWDQWTVCSSDEECVAIHDECGGWVGVNGQYQDQGTEYQNALAAGDKCINVKMAPPPKVLCLDHVCTAKPTNTEIGIN